MVMANELKEQAQCGRSIRVCRPRHHNYEIRVTTWFQEALGFVHTLYCDQLEGYMERYRQSYAR